MNDYALPLIVLRDLTKKYEEAMLKNQWALAYQISADMVEMALKLQDVTDED
jgi:16S rRNA C1402 (ribose-2'-O) methylase RsmI